eukprot:900874-Ditylum_brightwellii.AAC.1
MTLVKLLKKQGNLVDESTLLSRGNELNPVPKYILQTTKYTFSNSTGEVKSFIIGFFLLANLKN